ncbi:MAG TPA: hypothetical protein VFW22_16240 [Pseudolabrys sp.]|nr:hypothetical protein [Pseudolabrys sp.]
MTREEVHARDSAERAAGMAWARAWRLRNAPFYDRVFGKSPRPHKVCSACGGTGRVADG